MYKEALQKKLRFKTNKGMITTEDLFDLSLQNLNTLAIMLDKKISEAPKKSFIEELPAEENDDELRFSIVKDVINIKLKARKDNIDKAQADAQKKRILEILAKRNDEELEKKSTEELRAMLQN
jgi:hypothetical protein